MKRLLYFALLAIVATSCAKRRALVTPTTAPAEVRLGSGVRDFPRLLAQLSSALDVPVSEAALQALLIDSFGAPPAVSGETDFLYQKRVMDFISLTNYQGTGSQRSTALEANRMRLVGAFCERAVRRARAYPDADARRGLFQNVAVTLSATADYQRFLDAAGPVFRAGKTIPQNEREIILTGVQSIAGTAGPLFSWFAICAMVAGEAEAGEL